MIVTTPFAEMVEKMVAYYDTDQTLPAVVIDHPTQSLKEHELPARSAQIADLAMRLLDGLQPE